LPQVLRPSDDADTMDRLSTLTTQQYQHLQAADLMRALSARAFGGRGSDAAEYFAERWPRSVHLDVVKKHFEAPYTKAAVAAGNTQDATWAGPLMVPGLLAGFVPLVKAASVLGKLPLSVAPFNIKISRQTAGSSTAWVGEGIGKPTSKLAFGNVTLPWSKAVSFIVITKELLRLTEPGSVEQLQTTLRDEMVVFVDKEFLSSTAAVANVRPAGILNGITPVTATADLAADLKTLVNTFFAARPYPSAPYFICSPAVASKIAALDIGREVTVNGGTLLGLPVVTTPAAAANAIVVDAPGIFVANAGIDLDVSEEALLQTDSAPDSPATAATVFISLFQTNQIAIRAEQFVHWVVVASNAVQFVTVA
jgi:HK97 family phage major capsid protein